MMHHDDMWHIAGTIVFDENAHWGGPADDEPGGGERHEQGQVRAPSGEVPCDKDWGRLEIGARFGQGGGLTSPPALGALDGGHLQVVDDETARSGGRFPDHGDGCDAR